MFNKFTLLASALVLSAGVSFAQQPCTTDDHYHRLLQQYPQLADYEKQFEAQIDDAIANKTTSATDTTFYDVPIVVHVVHDYGAENVTDNVIYDAAAYWAQVYVCHNTDTNNVIAPFKKWVGNPRIRLHLATKDPNGNPTKGIDRINHYLTFNADDQAKFNDWPQNKYVNIWLINTFGAAETGAAAYAYVPASASFQPYYDGIICLATYTNQDKTIQHEMGHVLNLQHPWGNTNNPGVACGNDGVDDTPPTKGHNPTGCTVGSLYDTTCATGYMKTYHPPSGDSVVNYPDTTNAQNIMDYTYCQRMFTIGQVVRMRTALLSSTASRNNLITPANLAATGALDPMPDLAPIADFIMNKGTSTSTTLTDARTYFLAYNSGANFVFRNASWNDTVSSVAWTFSNGATNATSTSATTVTNQFSQPGWVSVSLTATSNAGSNTITDPHAVYAADPVAVGGMGYQQKFAAAANFANWPMFNFYKNQFQYQYYTAGGYDDNACIRYRSYDSSTRRTGYANGDHDDLYTPAFDLNGVTGKVYLHYYTAGATVSTSLAPQGERVRGDSLEIYVSTNGGQKWTKIASHYGTDLANNGVKAGEFVPTSQSQWVARGDSIAAVYRTSSTFFRFRYWPGTTGNNLYLDNFGLDQWPAGVQEQVAAGNVFSIFPNPATNGFNLVFQTGADGVVNYNIKDITGKMVYEQKVTLAPNTVQQQQISRSATPAAGMYLVTVIIDGVSKTQKLVVY